MAEIDVTRIAGNIGAMNSLNSLANINKKLSIHQTRLATGKRINTAADDPAGLTIATKMMSRSEGLKTALNNIGDAKNLLAVAESGMGRINDILVQMRNLSETGASDTMGTEERKALVTQMSSYAEQINDIVAQTKWNDKSLLDGTINGGDNALRFQTGADQNDATNLNEIKNLNALDGGLNLGSTATTQSGGTLVGSAALSNAAFATPDVASGSNALGAGDYVVKVTYGAADADTTVQLFRADDQTTALSFDYDADGTTETTATLTAGASGTIDFGNGLSVDVAANTTASSPYASTAQSSTVYGFAPQTDTVNLATSTGVTIDENASAADFAQYMADIEGSLDKVSEELSKLGSLTGRLTFKEDQISAAQINTEAAYNRVMNANMAEEQVNASKYQILQQTATAMLAQANAAPQFLLSLFR